MTDLLDNQAIADALHRDRIERLIVLGHQADVDDWLQARRLDTDTRPGPANITVVTTAQHLDRVRGASARFTGLVVLPGGPATDDPSETARTVNLLRHAGARILAPTWPARPDHIVYRAAEAVDAAELPAGVVGRWVRVPRTGPPSRPHPAGAIASMPGRYERRADGEWAEVCELRPAPRSTSTRDPLPS